MEAEGFTLDAYLDAPFLEMGAVLDFNDSIEGFNYEYEEFDDFLYEYGSPHAEFEEEQTRSEDIPAYLSNDFSDLVLPAPFAGSPAEYAEFLEDTIRENMYIDEWLIRLGSQHAQQLKANLQKSRDEIRQVNQDWQLLCLYPDLTSENFELLPVNPENGKNATDEAGGIEVILGDTSVTKSELKDNDEEDSDNGVDLEWVNVLDSSKSQDKSGQADNVENIDSPLVPAQVDVTTVEDDSESSFMSDYEDPFDFPGTPPTPPTPSPQILEKLSEDEDAMDTTEDFIAVQPPLEQYPKESYAASGNFMPGFGAAIIQVEEARRYDGFGNGVKVSLREMELEVEAERRFDSFARDMMKAIQAVEQELKAAATEVCDSDGDIEIYDADSEMELCDPEEDLVCESDIMDIGDQSYKSTWASTVERVLDKIGTAVQYYR